MDTVSVRLPAGVYAAIGELAAQVGVNKTDMATALVWCGLVGEIGLDPLSKSTRTAFSTDALEAYISIVRALAKLRAEQRRSAMQKFGRVVERLEVDLASGSPR